MKAVLGRRNDWWSTGKTIEGTLYNVARDELSDIQDCLNARRIQLIVGPRRVGKSTIMMQTIDYLLK